MKKEAAEHTFLDDSFNDPMTFIDLGACRGEFSNEILNSYRVEKAILVEANPTNFNSLKAMPNVKLYNRAASNKENAVIEFYEDAASPYNGSMYFNYFNGIKHSIPTISLRQIIEENNISHVDLLKVDVEGAEYDIFENVDDSILAKIGQITIEFHDFVDPSYRSRNQNIIDKLTKHGFKHTAYKSISYKYGSDHFDVLFYR